MLMIRWLFWLLASSALPKSQCLDPRNVHLIPPNISTAMAKGTAKPVVYWCFIYIAIYYSSFHLLFHYPYITPDILYSSFHFVFYYPYTI